MQDHAVKNLYLDKKRQTTQVLFLYCISRWLYFTRLSLHDYKRTGLTSGREKYTNGL